MSKTTKKILAICLCAALCLGGAGMAFAQASSKKADDQPVSAAQQAAELQQKISKDETVYVLTGADGSHPGATEARQAFRGGATADIPAAGQERRVDIYVDMERPMAKFRFIATDVNEFLSRRSRGIDDYYRPICPTCSTRASTVRPTAVRGSRSVRRSSH